MFESGRAVFDFAKYVARCVVFPLTLKIRELCTVSQR